MEKTTIKTSSSPEVIIDESLGNLYIKGWERSEVTATHAPDELSVKEQEDVVYLSCRSECTVRLPYDASLHVKSAHGNLRIKRIEDPLVIGDVYGGLEIRDVADVKVDNVYGYLRAKRISGDLVVSQIKGNATVRNVQGVCLLQIVNGNADLRDIDADIRTVINGNARIKLSALSGSEYDIKVDGNLHCRITEDANVTLELASGGENIRVKTSEGVQSFRERKYTFKLGTGGVSMKLSAAGNIYVTAMGSWGENEAVEEFAPIPDDFGDQIAEQLEAQIEEQMEIMNRQLSEQFEQLSVSISKAGLSAEERDRIMERAREKSERASLKAQEKMRLAQEKLARKMEGERRRQEARASAGQRRGRKKTAFSAKHSVPQTQTDEPVSEEERLMILRMLEEKKITLEEADQLLSALEGQEG
jgi:hypothetical protein